MKKLLIIATILLIAIPGASSAKSGHPKGYERAKGSSIAVTEPLGWPVSVSAKVGKLDGSIESLPGMTVIRVKAYKSWYNMFTTIPATTTLTIKGLPANKQLHIYTNGYRVHTIVTTNNSGTLTLDRPTGRGMQVIIKERPSTYHIIIGGILNPAGGDCTNIGTWTASTKTCTLSGDVSQTIAIDDPGITLNGNNKFVSAGVGADAINTDQSNVTVKNVKINNSARGVVFADTLTSITPSGGTATNIIVTNTIRPYVIEGIPNISATQLNLTGGDTNVRIEDQLDGFNTDGITISDSTLKNAASAAFYANDSDVYATITHTNFINNIADISGNGAHLTLNTTANRGNYWDRNRDCGQSGNECTHSHTPATSYTDAAPWACENAWVSGITCPVVPPPPPPASSLQERASITAHELIGAPYYLGGKGYDYTARKFADANKIITNGYKLYDQSIPGFVTLPGIDCSGLSMWSFDKTQNGNSPVDFNWCTKDMNCAIAYAGADGQYRYNTSHITINDLLPGDLLFFDTDDNGIMDIDHMAMYVGGTGQNTIHASGFANSVTFAHLDTILGILTTTRADGRTQRLNVTAYGRQKSPKVELIIKSMSPVHLEVTDPNGFTSSISNTNGPMEYQVHDIENNGDLNDIVLSGERLLGEYKIRVTPKSDALPTETYSVIAEALINGSWITLPIAENVSIANIPTGGYTLSSRIDSILIGTSTHDSGEVEDKVTICHRPPGNPDNAHTITVGEPAVRAHMAHGDTMGACSTTRHEREDDRDDDHGDRENKDKEKDDKDERHESKISPGQEKKELNTAGGGFVPPGQAKKNKK